MTERIATASTAHFCFGSSATTPSASARTLVAFQQDRHPVVGQRVVGRDHVGVHAEQTEDQHRDETGAVLARRAVEDDGLRVRRGDEVEHRDEPVPEAVEHEEVELVHRDDVTGRPLPRVRPSLAAGLVDDRHVPHVHGRAASSGPWVNCSTSWPARRSITVRSPSTSVT